MVESDRGSIIQVQISSPRGSSGLSFPPRLIDSRYRPPLRDRYPGLRLIDATREQIEWAFKSEALTFWGQGMTSSGYAAREWEIKRLGATRHLALVSDEGCEDASDDALRELCRSREDFGVLGTAQFIEKEAFATRGKGDVAKFRGGCLTVVLVPSKYRGKGFGKALKDLAFEKGRCYDYHFSTLYSEIGKTFYEPQWVYKPNTIATFTPLEPDAPGPDLVALGVRLLSAESIKDPIICTELVALSFRDTCAIVEEIRRVNKPTLAFEPNMERYFYALNRERITMEVMGQDQPRYFGARVVFPEEVCRCPEGFPHLPKCVCEPFVIWSVDAQCKKLVIIRLRSNNDEEAFRILIQIARWHARNMRQKVVTLRGPDLQPSFWGDGFLDCTPLDDSYGCLSWYIPNYENCDWACDQMYAWS